MEFSAWRRSAYGDRTGMNLRLGKQIPFGVDGWRIFLDRVSLPSANRPGAGFVSLAPRFSAVRRRFVFRMAPKRDGIILSV
jgi:hypothetical protein